DKVVPIEINLIGKFNIYNALCSIAACSAFGIPMDDIVNGLKKLKNVIGRSEKIISSSGFTILIDFAHTPNEIKNILKTAREYTKNKLVIVFGCGGDRDKAKRPIMGKIAGELSDF
ncbi:MAG TPA: UDP-N-acetylmuramoyl-L-alanyl-D-glutamate--2,6-diaminopimelate ligase, partial [Clostridiaceae bacterium]|nr:UDP-N-acetylmuramoyl-L-alanyl-D-glutamate--2,6-diaminopimelate ligase [Clostridiaceae bacterium]HCL51137.1 UDP-N-acetylmuramoyl-L-alanyl-D-glutamate--2,6-diaminopimelate ligase [Clostridiaceae bacterium]